MKDEMIKAAATQRAAVMEQATGVSREQTRQASLEQRMTARQDAISKGASQSYDDLNDRASCLMESLKDAFHGGTVTQEAAERWQQESGENLFRAADQANTLIAAVLSDAQGRDRDTQQQALDTVEAVVQAFQKYSAAVDEATRTLRSDIERSIYEGAADEQLQDNIEKSSSETQELKDTFDRSLEQIAAARNEERDAVAIQQTADNGARKDEEVSENRARKGYRDVKLDDVAEQVKSGIYTSPDVPHFADEVGRDAIVKLVETRRLRDVDAQIHHIRSRKEEPELALSLKNLELLSRRAHTEGAHGRNFNEQRNGQAADPNYDQHSGFNMPRSLGELGPNEDLDDLVPNASKDAPHEAEDRMNEDADAAIERERREAAEDQALRRQALIDQIQQEQEREEQLRTEEHDRDVRETERRGQERSDEARVRDQQEQEERERQRATDERRRLQQEEERGAAQRRQSKESD